MSFPFTQTVSANDKCLPFRKDKFLINDIKREKFNFPSAVFLHVAHNFTPMTYLNLITTTKSVNTQNYL